MRAPKQLRRRRARRGARKIALLADRAGHMGLGPAFAFIGLAAGQQRLSRAVARRIDIEAAAFLESLALAKPVGAVFAIRRAIGRDRTTGTALDAWRFPQPRQCIRR